MGNILYIIHLVLVVAIGAVIIRVIQGGKV